MSETLDSDDRYPRIRQLGEGSSGRVWLVEDRFRPGSRLALKALTEVRGARVEGLRLEFATLTQLSHPNLVTVHDLDLHPEQGSPLFTMEWIEGRDIVAAVQREGVDTFLRLAAEALRALAFLHDFGLIHRDLKPANMLVRDRPRLDCRLVVLDFGLAMRGARPDNSSPPTGGTLPYLAPELFEGRTPGARSDLYGLGAVLFEAIHGRPPVELDGRSLDKFVEMVRVGRRARPKLPAGYPDALRIWFDEMLSPDPQHRPARAREALARLNATCDRKFPDETPASRAARLASGPPPGREREIKLLWEYLSPSEGPRLVWLCGRSGSGKQRLLRWLSGEAVSRGWDVVALTPDRLATATTDSRAQVASELETLRSRADQRPTLVLLEGVHSAGGPVIELLERLAREGRAAPVRVVAALRAEEVRHPKLRRLLEHTGTVPTLRRIDLEPLDPAGVRALAERASGTQGVSEAKVRWLVEASEGQPMSAEILLVEGVWEKGGRKSGSIALDESLAARLARFSDEGVAWFEALSVLRHESSDALLAAISELEAESAREAGAEIAAAGLARRHAAGWATTSRMLSAQVLRNMGAERRQELHSRAAELLAADGKAAERTPHLLARLWSGAGQPERSVASALRAAEQAADRGDSSNAADHLGFALRHLGRKDPRRLELRLQQARRLREANLPQAAARAYGASLALAGDREKRADVLARQAGMLVLAGRFVRARAVAEEALDIADSAGLPVAAARAREAIGIVLARTGHGRKAMPFLEGAVGDFGAIGDRAAQAHAYQMLGICQANEGHPDARKHFERALELYAELGQKGMGLINAVGLGSLEMHAGHFESARLRFEEIRRIAFEHGNLLMQGITNHFLAKNCIQHDRYSEAVSLSFEAEDQALHLGDYRLICGSRSVRGQALVRCGRPAEATAMLESTLEGPIGKVDPVIVDNVRLALIEARMATRQPDKSRIRDELQACLDRVRQWRDPDTLLWCLAVEMERRAQFPTDEPIESVATEFEQLAEKGGLWFQPFHSVRAELARAVWQLSRNESAKAQRHAQIASNLALEAEIPSLAAQAQLLIAESAESEGEPGGSSSALTRGRQLLDEAVTRIDDAELSRGFLERPVLQRLRQPFSLSSSAQDRRLLALYSMIRGLNSETDPDRLLESTLDMALEVVRAERGMVMLREPDSERFSVSLARNLENETVEDAESFSRHVVAEASTGKAVLTLDALHDDRFRDLKSVSLYGIRSVMCVPLVSRSSIIGAVYLDSRSETNLFTAEDLKFLEAFADHASLALEKARAWARLVEDCRRLRVAAEERVHFDNLIGRCQPMQAVFDLIEKVAASQFSVLIQGDTGTGKELVARAIHFNGPRKDKPFISENCAAVPETLLQSELFGHVRGAFTGADRDRRGLFEQADGGTLFLDEVGDMTPTMQAQLLRVLQEGEVRRVGGDRSTRVDVRSIFATHRNLQHEVEAGRFREDLLYRMQVLVIHLPPLRDRGGDVPLLADHLLERIAEERGHPRQAIDRRLMTLLEKFSWPGNVRQLENTLRRLSILAGDDPITEAVLELDPVLTRLLRKDAPEPIAEVSTDLREHARIEEAIQAAKGNRSDAARLLGISRATLYRRMKELEIRPQKKSRVRRRGP